MNQHKGYGILFDYNGVLVGDEHLQYKAMMLALKAHQYNLTQEEYDAVCLGRTDQSGFEGLKAKTSRLASVDVGQLIDEKAKMYRKIVVQESIVYPGAPELIQELSRKYAIGVITGSLRVEVEPILRQSGIYELLSAFITAEDVSRGKPYPEGYKKGIQELGLPPDAVVAIEDSPAGVRAAKAAGLRCIGITETVGAEALQEADYIQTKTTDLTVAMINALFSQRGA